MKFFRRFLACILCLASFVFCVCPADASNQLTLYSRWNTQITFDAGEGGVIIGGSTDAELALAAQNVQRGSITYSLNQKFATGLSAKKQYHVLLDWNTEPDGTGISYQDVDTVTGPMTFYAVYYQNEFWYTGDYQVFTAPKSGYWQLEAWGSSGGYGNTTDTAIGYGGYTKGVIWLEQGTTLYVYVGQKGQNSAQREISYNGGAASPIGIDETHRGGGGGGATDFRLISGAWNDPDGLKSRILVAGGGGGANSYCSRQNTPGHGGGLTAARSTNIGYGDSVGSWEGLYRHYYAGGGTQTAGGIGYAPAHPASQANGTFGSGTVADTCCGGGGGGWYGGGSAYVCGGGGGSSYLIGYEGCDTTWQDYQRGLVGYDLTFTQVVLEQGVRNDNGYALASFISA